MKVFVVMPFGCLYDSVYSAIQAACSKLGVECARADEIDQPGPIINQIFENLVDADCVVADISDKNPNVYYEVGAAHGIGKPAILLARGDAIRDLPFDIKHNRVVPYEVANPRGMVNSLLGQLSFVRAAVSFESEGRAPEVTLSSEGPTPDAYLESLGTSGEEREGLVTQLMRRAEKEFELIGPFVRELRYSPDGLVITIGDALGQDVVIVVDINGIVRRMRRL